MFLLIALPPSPGCPLVHFNTSHVSINRLMRIDQNGPNYHFNTSHVSINPQRIMSLTYSIRISIHLMFLLIWRVHHICTCRWCISIHLMFLLITSRSNVYGRITSISIHLMFLLITERCGGFAGRSRISIHLMFLLISNVPGSARMSIAFQYISCFY